MNRGISEEEIHRAKKAFTVQKRVRRDTKGEEANDEAAAKWHRKVKAALMTVRFSTQAPAGTNLISSTSVAKFHQSKEEMQDGQMNLEERNLLINSLALSQEREGEAPWMIHPDLYALVAWHFLLVFWMICAILAVPVALGYHATPPMILVTASDIMFALDVAVGLTTGYHDGPLICMNSRKVVRRYMKTWFVGDVLAALPFGTLSYIGKLKAVGYQPEKPILLQALSLVKLFKFPKIDIIFVQPFIERAIDKHLCSRIALSFVELGIYFALLIHWIGCFYWMLSRATEPEWSAKIHYDEVDDDVWRNTHAARRGFCPHFQLRSASFFTQYIASIHWASYATYAGLPMIRGIDYIPLKRSQSAYETVCLMLGMLVLASMISGFGAVIDELRGGDRDKQKMLKDLDKYFTVRNVPEEVRVTIRRYILFLHERRILTPSSSTKKILDQLPRDIRNHVYGSAKLPVLQAPGHLFALCDEHLCYIVAARMGTVVFHPLQIICTQGEQCLGVHLVAKGSILLFMRAKPTPKALRLLGKHETFGEDVFVDYASSRHKNLWDQQLLRRESTSSSNRSEEHNTGTFADPTFHLRDSFYSAVARDFSEVLLLRAVEIAELRYVAPKFCEIYDACAARARETLCNAVAEQILKPWLKRRIQIRHLYRQTPHSCFIPSNRHIDADPSSFANEALVESALSFKGRQLDPHKRLVNNRLAIYSKISPAASKTSSTLAYEFSE